LRRQRPEITASAIARAPVLQAQLASAPAKGLNFRHGGPGTALARASGQLFARLDGVNRNSTGGETMRRLHIVLVILMLVVVALRVEAQQPTAHAVAMPDTLKWVEPGVLPGARLAVVQGDPSKEGLFAYRLKFPAGYKIPPHLHKASENVTVLSGEFFIGVGEKFDQGAGHELPVGGFVSIPPNHPHFAWAGAQETTVQVHGVGPSDFRFVNPADDPRTKK